MAKNEKKPCEKGDRKPYLTRKHKNCVEIYKNKACNISEACEACGISRKTFYEWKKTIPAFRDAVDDALEDLLDWSESKLITLIDQFDLKAILAFLEAKGKSRGYGKSQEIEHKGVILQVSSDFMPELKDEAKPEKGDE